MLRFFQNEQPKLDRSWKAFSQIMLDSNDTVYIESTAWDRDWLLSKYATGLGQLIPIYRPPENVYNFPLFELPEITDRLEATSEFQFYETKYNFDLLKAFENSSNQPSTVSAPYTIDAFYELESNIKTHRDSYMTQHYQCIAWVHLALGKLFSGIALSPLGDNFQDFVLACQQRWAHVWDNKNESEQYMKHAEIIQYKLDLFYESEISKDNIRIFPTRQGQSEKWRNHWSWISNDLNWEDSLNAVRIAAGLLNFLPITTFFQQLLKSENITNNHLLAVSIIRRWVMTLKVMTWLEEALQHRWKDIRPNDLICFAFSALRPHWPRRSVGISHRSFEAKPYLKNMTAWNHFAYSIDATFIPQWETNTGMIWGLFSAVPLLIRIKTPKYMESVWCRRESELIQYLIDHNDFLQFRRVIDLEEKEIGTIDEMILGQPNDMGGINPLRFPPLTTVFVLYPLDPWENWMLAGVAAVRLLANNLGGDTTLTQEISYWLATGHGIPEEINPPTNHPDGWDAFIIIFKKVYEYWGDGKDQFPITFENYSEEELQKDALEFDNVLDLSDGKKEFADVLAAFEYNRTLITSLIGNKKYGEYFVVDYRDITSDTYAMDEQFMIIRGLERIRMSIPIWSLQEANQSIDEWEGMGERPIFTQHTDKQWSWMMEMLLEPQWPARFEGDANVRFNKALKEQCKATTTRDSYYEGKIWAGLNSRK